MIVFSVGVLLTIFLWSRNSHSYSLIALGIIYMSIAGAWFPLGPLSRFSLLLFLVGMLLSYFICAGGSNGWKAKAFHSITFVPIVLSCLCALLHYPFAGFLLVLVGISFIATAVQLVKGRIQAQHRCLFIFPLVYALDKMAYAFV